MKVRKSALTTIEHARAYIRLGDTAAAVELLEENIKKRREAIGAAYKESRMLSGSRARSAAMRCAYERNDMQAFQNAIKQIERGVFRK